jgi:3-oxoacyl-[acyl-carrier-protein] synthase-3
MTVLTTSAGSKGARLLAFGAHLPARTVGNDEIAPAINSSDEWIRTRSGIETRHFSSAEESLADLAVGAGAKAIASAGVDPSAVDMVVVSTCTSYRSIPAVAPEVALRVGATGAGAFDVNATCAGFCYGLTAASDAVRNGNAHYALVIGAEQLSKVTDPTDRSLAFLLADGAGAAVVGPSDSSGIGPVTWGTDASAEAILRQDPDEEARSAAGLRFLRMDGPAVFRWAVTGLKEIAHAACERAGVQLSDIAAFVPHQANLRIIDSLVRSLKLPEHVYVARDVVNVGNTSSASIPMALARMVETGAVPSGSPVLLLGFGAGLAYAGQVVVMP